MPNEPGQDNTLQHAEVILRCRRGRLLQHLNRQEYSQAHLFLTKEIIPLKESISPYVNVDMLKTEIDYLSDCRSSCRSGLQRAAASAWHSVGDDDAVCGGLLSAHLSGCGSVAFCCVRCVRCLCGGDRFGVWCIIAFFLIDRAVLLLSFKKEKKRLVDLS